MFNNLKYFELLVQLYVLIDKRKPDIGSGCLEFVMNINISYLGNADQVAKIITDQLKQRKNNRLATFY